ncbi:putative zinc-binding metallopeptidase [Paraflavisolibacter sp. H34]|uniref:zinc-binding metallopeptidase n=1 Tax=Huijunlia imazamoxiresistens TaxID=3127457 RepID=UPI0030195D1E
MKILVKLFSVFYLLVALASCKKEEDLDTSTLLGLGGDTWAKSAIDRWLYDSLTKPYNIDVKYRWDPWEVNLSATLIPPDESKVIEAMSAMKQIWIDPYNAETGSELMIKKYAPRTFILVGSPEYLPNNTILLGQAEGGSKIAMYVINNFSKSNTAELRRMLHTIEHEFGHILHQNVVYPQEFKTITPNYTSTWFNISDAQAQSEGFVTGYAESGPDDDFVETLSVMLIEGKNRWEELVTSQNATAQSALRRKEEIVVNYFRTVWNIDFYSLQKRTQDAINRLSSDALDLYFGFGKPNTMVTVNPANTAQLTQSTGFTTIFNTAKAGVAAALPGLVLDSMAVVMNTATTMQLRLFLHNAAGNFLANYTYNVSRNAAGLYTFTYVGPADGNATFLATAVAALTNYFRNNTFKAEWFLSPNNTIKPLRVIFTPQQTANASFMGLLKP